MVANVVFCGGPRGWLHWRDADGPSAATKGWASSAQLPFDCLTSHFSHDFCVTIEAELLDLGYACGAIGPEHQAE